MQTSATLSTFVIDLSSFGSCAAVILFTSSWPSSSAAVTLESKALAKSSWHHRAEPTPTVLHTRLMPQHPTKRQR